MPALDAATAGQVEAFIHDCALAYVANGLAGLGEFEVRLGGRAVSARVSVPGAEPVILEIEADRDADAALHLNESPDHQGNVSAIVGAAARAVLGTEVGVVPASAIDELKDRLVACGFVRWDADAGRWVNGYKEGGEDAVGG